MNYSDLPEITIKTTSKTIFYHQKNQKTKGKEEDKKQAQWLAYKAGL